MLYAALGSLLATVAMEFWLNVMQTNSFTWADKNNDDISQWWTVNFLPFFVLGQGLLMGVVATRIAYLVGQSRLRDAFSIFFLTILVAALFFIVPVITGGAPLITTLFLVACSFMDCGFIHLWSENLSEDETRCIANNKDNVGPFAQRGDL